mgnify:CR=1 FL=1
MSKSPAKRHFEIRDPYSGRVLLESSLPCHIFDVIVILQHYEVAFDLDVLLNSKIAQSYRDGVWYHSKDVI